MNNAYWMNVHYLKSLDNTQPMLVRRKVAASQTIKYGDLLVNASGLVAKAGAAATGVFGIAQSDVTTGEADDVTILVQVINDKSVLRVNYTGTTKTSLAAADLCGTAFDIDSSQKLALDDTTGGMLLVIGYDNDSKTADVVIKASALWNA